MRDAVGDVPVGIRVTSDEFVVGGTVLDEAIEAVDLLLSQTQIDYVSVSVSNYASIETMIPDMSFPRKPFVENAAAIRKVARGVPVMTVGRIVTPENAEEILSTGTADLVCIVRPLIADPEWTNKALDGKRNRIRECISCNVGCRGGPHRGTPIACLVNPAVGYERTMGVGTLTTATHAKHVVVVGGGPGGLKAAETAALRGHRVTVVEKQARTGGRSGVSGARQADSEQHPREDNSAEKPQGWLRQVCSTRACSRHAADGHGARDRAQRRR